MNSSAVPWNQVAIIRPSSCQTVRKRSHIMASRQIAQFSMRSRMIRRSGSRPGCASGMPGGGREISRVDADPPQRLLIFQLYRRIENKRRIGRAVQPAIVLDFGLKLARCPAGIAERVDGAIRPCPFGNGAQDVDGGSQRDAIVNRQRGIVDEVIGGMQDKASARLDG